MIESLEKQFTKYEIARILGARALQIAMDAPLLLKISEAELEEISYNPIEIAKKELLAEVLPITIVRPLPNKKESKIQKLTKEELESLKRKEKEKELAANKEAVKESNKKDDEKLLVEEESEEKKVAEDSEIMELSTPEDEIEEDSSGASEEA